MKNFWLYMTEAAAFQGVNRDNNGSFVDATWLGIVVWEAYKKSWTHVNKEDQSHTVRVRTQTQVALRRLPWAIPVVLLLPV